MKPRDIPHLFPAVMILLALSLGPVRVWSQAIPEPPQLLFGQIYNPAGGPYSRVTTGTLTWAFRPLAGGPPVVAAAICTNQYAPYAFLLEVPGESVLPGLVISSNVLAFTSPAQTYDESGIQLDGQTVYLKHPAQNLLTLGSDKRGQMVEMDLTLQQSDQDTDGNGLPDAWQLQYFGHLGVDPNAIPNHNGMSNLAAYLAGTNPDDPTDTFRLLSVRPGTAGSWEVSWTSATNRTYTLHRASSLAAGFQVVTSGIASAGAVTQFLDNPPATTGTYFYQVSIP